MAILVAGHAINDIYQGAVPALVPFLAAQRGFGYLDAAGITLAATLLSSIAQPLFGLLTDRCPAPWLVPAGTVVAGAGIAASGVAGSYALTWLVVAASGLGVAAYHPESARLARVASAGSHVAMSWFSLGGNLGFAAGPLLVTGVLSATGLAGTPLLVVPALAGSLITAAMLWRWRNSRSADPAAQPAVPAASAASDSAGWGLADDWRAFRWLSLAVVCRSVVAFGLSTFLALHVQEETGGGTAAGEAALVVLFATGAVGTLVGGRLAGRYGRVRTVRVAYAALMPALAALVLLSGPAVYLAVAAVGVISYIPFSLHVTLGQDYLPNRIGTASGVTLGLAVSIGGITAPALAGLAQATTLPTALSALLLFPLIAWFATRSLIEPQQVLTARPTTSARR